MENMEHVYKAEAEALRRYRQKNRDAVNELEDAMKHLDADCKMPTNIKNAIINILELNNE